MTLEFGVHVNVQRVSGKFVSRDDIADAILEALDQAISDLDLAGLGADGDSEYEVVEANVEPGWRALPGRAFTVADSALVRRASARGVTARVGAPAGDLPVLVASHRDELLVPGPILFLEHGAGQHYGGVDASGEGVGRPRVVLYLAPNPAVAARTGAVMPNACTAAVGCPKLDRWLGWVPSGRPEPVVGLAWHWPSRSWPEAMWAYPHYRGVLAPLARRYRVLGHGHPRVFGHLISDYRRAGIEAVADPEQLLTNIDLLVADNTSVLFEAAAVGLPVVVLDAPWYRRGVEHGLRFWTWADVGPRIGRAADLAGAVERAWAEREAYRPVREAMRAEGYGAWDGRAGPRAAQALSEAIG